MRHPGVDTTRDEDPREKGARLHARAISCAASSSTGATINLSMFAMIVHIRIVA